MKNIIDIAQSINAKSDTNYRYTKVPLTSLNQSIPTIGSRENLAVLYSNDTDNRNLIIYNVTDYLGKVTHYHAVTEDTTDHVHPKYISDHEIKNLNELMNTIKKFHG